MKLIATSVAALALGTTGAFAGGLSEPVTTPVVAPAPAPVMAAPTYDWSGFYVGGQYGRGTVSIDGQDDSEEDFDSYGVHAGYLADLGSYVLGGELDYGVFDVVGADDSDDTIFRAKAIAGYDAGRFMPYLTAGYAQINLEDGGDGSDSADGYLYGAGVAYAVTDSLRVGGEVVQHRFEDAFDSGEDYDATSVSLKVSYAF